jgi:hypothetical protein
MKGGVEKGPPVDTLTEPVSCFFSGLFPFLRNRGVNKNRYRTVL